jgi:hypothetical protein
MTPPDATFPTLDSPMTAPITTDDSQTENDLLIRRSRDRTPPGSLELGPVSGPGVRGKVREYPVFIRGAEVIGLEVIYGLVDPREPGRVRYVGKSNSPHSRLRGHIAAGEGKLAAWIESIRGRRHEQYPNLVLLECVKPGAVGRERYWYDTLRALGEADLNGVAPRGDVRDFHPCPRGKRNRNRRKKPHQALRGLSRNPKSSFVGGVR